MFSRVKSDSAVLPSVQLGDKLPEAGMQTILEEPSMSCKVLRDNNGQ